MYAFDSEIKYISRKNLLPIYFKKKKYEDFSNHQSSFEKSWNS